MIAEERVFTLVHSADLCARQLTDPIVLEAVWFLRNALLNPVMTDWLGLKESHSLIKVCNDLLRHCKADVWSADLYTALREALSVLCAPVPCKEKLPEDTAALVCRRQAEALRLMQTFDTVFSNRIPDCAPDRWREECMITQACISNLSETLEFFISYQQASHAGKLTGEQAALAKRMFRIRSAHIIDPDIKDAITGMKQTIHDEILNALQVTSIMPDSQPIEKTPVQQDIVQEDQIHANEARTTVAAAAAGSEDRIPVEHPPCECE